MADPARFTYAQMVTLRALLERGDSDHLTQFQSKGLASLERRGLVVKQGGRRKQGRAALRVLSDEGKLAARRIEAARTQR
jgi:DNA-binding MarR family transcriptional regulator